MKYYHYTLVLSLVLAMSIYIMNYNQNIHHEFLDEIKESLVSLTRHKSYK